jgi:hypothetical protein
MCTTPNLFDTHQPPPPSLPIAHAPAVTSLAAALLQQSRDGTSAGGYSLIPLHAWSHNVTDARTVQALVNAAAPGAVEFVTPDVFVARIVANVLH